MIKYSITLVFIAFIFTIGFAQPLNKVRYETMIETADEAYLSKDYYNAAEWYENAYKERKDKDFAIKVADCHMHMRNYKRAISWYKRVISRDKLGTYNQYKLEYGKALKMQGEYNDAYAILNEFVEESEDVERKKYAALMMNGIAKSAEFGDNVDAIIKPAGRKVNSASSEAGPNSYASDLYFSAIPRKDEIVYNGDLEGETYFKIYYTGRDDDGEFKKPTALSDEVNREGYHSSHPTFSGDETKMYFVRTLIEEGEIIETLLYVSERNGNTWGAATEVEGDIQGEYTIKHPAIGELYGKEVIFFAGDIEGGFGGFDIYYSEKTGNGSFGTPINLGETINTIFDDISPFYRDGELFFSSEGYPGYGGLDIFKTSWDGTKWSEVINMGSGYNSTYDDSGYSLDEEGMQGYLISNRPAERKRSVLSKTCCDDIFTVNMREVVIDLMALVTDGENPLKEAEVTLIDLSKGDDKAGPEIKSNLNSNSFNFALDADKPYRVVVKRKDYYPDSIEFNTVGILDDFTVERTIALKAVPPPPPPPKEETEIVTINEPIRMSNIYYDFDSDKILPSAEGDLSYILELMNKYTDMIIELSSHTDSKGLTKYNQELSQRRANSAKNWLTSRGVDPSRIQAVGYGESVILNRCVNGVRCSDDEHRFNRRTEFKIIAGPQTIEIKKQKKVISPGNGMPMNNDIDLYNIQDDNTTEIKFLGNEYKLGTIRKGEKVDMEFEFKNTGNNDLLIEVVTACHCTTFEYVDEPVQPGEKAVIKATFDSGVKGKIGDLKEVINIICNTDNLVEEAIFYVTVVEE